MEITSDTKIVLVRSPRKLIDKSQIGYGWKEVDFSRYNNVNELLDSGFKNYAVGRKKKQIKRYFNLKNNDLVVVPVSGAIAIAKVVGEKTYEVDDTVKYGENRIKVEYLSDKFIPRKTLTTALQNRLKIRTSIASLDDFSDEIEKHINSLAAGEIYTLEKEVEAKEAQAEKVFKEELLERLKKGKNISISSGGYGLEVLVKELLKIEGYSVKIPAKNTNIGIADVDIIASKHNHVTSDIEELFIQVKHHDGLTSSKGLKQLEAYRVNDEDYYFHRKILITSARLDDSVRDEALEKGIVTMEGEALVDWIYDNIEQLDSTTKVALGITIGPSLI